ncbi:NHL repeat-containing protein [Marinilabilia rubra]|uniref:Phytase n=1 Tax=Marinilabilia rubra TaxID=2162893 RepID=A0A2U2B973_9BACT|nr:phytase precursor [Marinilabilia rubra]PWD99618.1 phytase precursor [Marinilabilia rubra]
MDFKSVKIFLLIITIIAAGILVFVLTAAQQNRNSIVKEPCPCEPVAVIEEAFHTQRDESDNVDSPALWHGPEGENWLLATAKEGHSIFVFDAKDGRKIKTFGTEGSGMGELMRPNGIAVIDSLALIVERDNRRVQIFSLPACQPLGTLGEDQLIRPYGIAIQKTSKGYELFVTDNYEMADESIPPVDSLYHRVHHFAFTAKNDSIQAEHLNAFGDTSGEGILYKVESILWDQPLNRLLIADEYEMQRNIKIYTPEGKFTGEIISHQYFRYEPEGMALWACDEDTSGYYVTTDQDVINNNFPVFDRKSLKYLGSFAGKITRNTDGIFLSQKPYGGFENGAFFPVHDDGSITAIDWTNIADSLKLRINCQ